MKKSNNTNRLTTLFLLLILCLTSFAQSLENSLLWKIEKEDIKTSYLLGTFHMLSKSDFEMDSKVLLAFNSTEQLVMELKMDNPGIQLEMMQYMGMKDGITLNQLLDSVDYKKLDSALKEAIGMGVMMFNTFKPMLVGTFLILNYIEGEPASFELTLTAMATEKEMPVVGLETVEYQMSIFDKIPYEDQAEDLMEMVNETEKMSKLYEKMVSTYRDEDINTLYRLTVEDAGSEKELEMLLFSRNRDWITKIGKLSKDQPTFYGVGAAHLGGKEGLIMLLRKAGYKVTPVF